MTDQNPYRTGAVRDLAWSLQSPPLLLRQDAAVHWPPADWFENAYREFAPALQQLDRDPGDLLKMLDSGKDRRLGRHFETLLHYWLQQDTRFRLLHANLPVRDTEKTLGEFDLIVHDERSGKTLHWEVAVKFYLGLGDTSQPQNWWGPARRDRLDLKTGHLLNHQGRLSAMPQARAMLDRLGIRIDATWLIMKGRLFYPLGSNSAAPTGAEPRHLRGFWLHAKDLADLPDGRWMPVEKSQWLAPLPASSTQAFDRRTLIEWWHDHPRACPRCIAACGDQGETTRAFVVPDDWDQEALPL